MEPFSVVTVTGKRVSGKTRYTEVLEARLHALGVETRAFAFADAIKHMTAERFGLDAQRLIADRDYKEAHRHHIILVADQCRAKDPDVFINRVLADMSAWEQQPAREGRPIRVAIVSDCRMKKELHAVGQYAFRQKWDCVSVCVRAKDATRKRRGWAYKAEIDDHPTETDLDGEVFRVCVDNDADGPAGLNEAVGDLLDTLGAPPDARQ